MPEPEVAIVPTLFIIGGMALIILSRSSPGDSHEEDDEEDEEG